MFPLAVCQHISPSLVPAGDHEWTFVVNFETVAIRFSCNSRETMEEWVDCIRNKLGEMGILNPKGNLYSRVPSINPSKTRNPMSPLPQPPSAENRPPSQQANQSQLITNPNQGSSTNENNNQSFTTSIYLNQAVTNTQPSEPSVTVAAQTSVTVTPQASASAASVSTVSTTTSSGATSSVYLNKSNPTRHVTRIPINKENGEEEQENENETQAKEDDEPYYDAIPDMPASEPKPRIPSVLKKRQQSPSKQPSLPPSQDKEELARRSSDKAQPQRIKKKSQRSSSLGPLLDEQSPIGTSMANTNSLESIDSNPRQKLPKGDLLRERPHGRIRATGAIPRRPLALSNSQEATTTPANPNIGKLLLSSLMLCWRLHKRIILYK